ELRELHLTCRHGGGQALDELAVVRRRPQPGCALPEKAPQPEREIPAREQRGEVGAGLVQIGLVHGLARRLPFPPPRSSIRPPAPSRTMHRRYHGEAALTVDLQPAMRCPKK